MVKFDPVISYSDEASDIFGEQNKALEEAKKEVKQK